MFIAPDGKHPTTHLRARTEEVRQAIFITL